MLDEMVDHDIEEGWPYPDDDEAEEEERDFNFGYSWNSWIPRWTPGREVRAYDDMVVRRDLVRIGIY
jgi:hypothetical protein